MKVEVSRIGTRGYAITRGDLGIFQRSHPDTVADPSLSIKEKLICDLCETILATQREAMQECALLLEHAALPTDKQIQEWRERESTRKLGNLEYDEEVVFCHADLCADKIRALVEENKGGKTCPE